MWEPTIEFILLGAVNVWKPVCLMLLALLLAGATYEKYPAIRKRIRPKRWPWEELNEEYFAAIRDVARSQLLTGRGGLSLRLDQMNRSRTETTLRSALKPRSRNSWPSATLVLGLCTSFCVFGEEKDIEAIEAFCRSIIDKDGAFYSQIAKVDQCMIGYSLLELAERTQEEQYVLSSEKIVNFLLNEHPTSQTGTLPYRGGKSRSLLLVDTLGMICPFLARYGEKFGVREATALAVKQIGEFVRRGIDRRTGLVYHAYSDGKEGKLGIGGWARGTGWFAIGLVNTLAHLRKKHEAYGGFAGQLRLLVGVIREYQTEQGCWRWTMNLPNAPLDTSGTAMLAYAIERGIEIGVLDPNLSEVSMRAMHGIILATDEQGVIGQAQAECWGVGAYPIYFGPAAWAQGPAVALSATILRRQKGI